MQKQLSSFDGRDVQASVAKFSGKVAQRVGQYHEGEFAFVVCKVKVGSITHADFKPDRGANAPRMYSRIHDCSATQAFILPEKSGQKLFDQARQVADDEYGIASLFGQPTSGDEDDASTDGEGTPA